MPFVYILSFVYNIYEYNIAYLTRIVNTFRQISGIRILKLKKISFFVTSTDKFDYLREIVFCIS